MFKDRRINMNFNEFKTEIIGAVGELKKCFVQKGVNIEVFVQEAESVNIKGENLVIKPGDNTNVCFSKNLKELYEIYNNYGDFSEFFSEFVKILQDAFSQIRLMNGDLILKSMAKSFNDGNIVFSLVNAYDNQKLLKDVPHRRIADLAIIYRVVCIDEQGRASTVIHNNLAEEFNKTEEELYEMAYNNMKQNYPITLDTLGSQAFSSLISLFTDEDGNISNLDFENIELDSDDLYVLSNSRYLYGATAILFDNVLETIANKFDSDLYIIPSSIHELIIASKDYIDSQGNIDYFIDMISEVNAMSVNVKDRLSNQLYWYDREEKSFKKVESDAPESVLDY